MRPGLLVLDFDGMDEFVETSWRALAEITGREIPAARRADLGVRFAALRPVVESGWEMVVLLGVLSERPAAGDPGLRDDWAAIRDTYVRSHAMEPGRMAAAVDAVRARWMEKDARGWVERHRFYPGMAAWLARLAGDGGLVYVLSTKAKPFL